MHSDEEIEEIDEQIENLEIKIKICDEISQNDQSHNKDISSVSQSDQSHNKEISLASNTFTSKSKFLMSAIKSNNKYKESLYIMIRKIEENLHQIETKRKALQTLHNQCKHLKERDKDRELSNYIFGAPYFKDADHFPGPQNFESKQIFSNKLLRYINLNSRGQWNIEEKSRVKKAVNKQLSQMSSSSKMDSQTIDWQSIAACDVPMHSADECKAMWDLILQPGLCKAKWTKTEAKKLEIVAQKNNFFDWDLIAQELGGKRSSLQCFIHFQTAILNDNSAEKWSKDEERLLLSLVDKYKIGKNYIPWSTIAAFFEDRTKDDIYTRYISINPNIKKGYFTEEEDDALIAAVISYNGDFNAIPIEELLPGRTVRQARSRYYNTLRHSHLPAQVWDIDSDMKLLELVKQYGRKWAYIAQVMVTRTRSSCRHRFDMLQQFISKNPELTLVDAPRKANLAKRILPTSKVLSNLDHSSSTMQLVKTSSKSNVFQETSMSDVDSRILKYFCSMDYHGNRKGGRVKTIFDSKELNCMQNMVEDLLKVFNVEISMSKMEEQLLSGNFNNYTEPEKLLINFMLDNYRRTNEEFIVNQCSQTSQVNLSTNNNSHIPTTSKMINLIKHEDFTYEPLSSKRIKTYTRKPNIQNKSTEQKSISAAKPTGSTLVIAPRNDKITLSPNFATLVAMRTIITAMGEKKQEYVKESDELISQLQDAARFKKLFRNIFLWPSLMSYVKPECDATDMNSSNNIVDVSEESCDAVETIDLHDAIASSSRKAKRKFMEVE